MRTAIFGGTFNPVHIGHLFVAEEILAMSCCDRILFIPAHTPPHKSVDDPGPEIRFRMLLDSIADTPAFQADGCELERAGISYSIDTVRYLVQNRIVEPRPVFVLGDDLIQGFGRWKMPEALAAETELLVFHRGSPERLHFGYPHRYLDNLPLPISSSMIRERIAGAAAWRSLVPAPARGIIESLHLYGFHG
jgi:nicotinate-nucleotide adenylyltransferase